MKTILTWVWQGLWTGFGVELSFLIIWLGWKLAHSKIAHRLHADHWFHRVGEYLDG